MLHLYFIRTGMLCLLLSALNCSYGQDGSGIDKALALPDKIFNALDKKTALVTSKLDHQTTKYLSRLQKQENKLRRKLYKKDSALAHQLFDGVQDQYSNLKNSTAPLNKYDAVYSGHLDSLSTALSFIKNADLSSYANNPELQNVIARYKGLQDKFNASDQIKKYLEKRQALLKQQFQNLGMVKELKQFQKQVYYYRQEEQEFRQAFEDPSKLEQKLMDVMMKIPEFKNFFSHHSILASLFPMPDNDAAAATTLQGLQTRSMVNQSLADRFGSGPDVTAQLQQNLQSAQGQLSDLKNQLNQYSSGSYGNGSSDQSMPDFKTNPERVHSFFKRLEFGFNLQSQKARYMYPRTVDFGLSLGYKLNQNNVAGIGFSSRIGFGTGWNHIAITYQSVGLRSFIDMKLKGSISISGGFEMNYMKLITTTAQLKDYSAWQKSSLIGLSKRYAISKKIKGEIKLFWDALSSLQVPPAPPFVFRFAYTIK